MTQTPSRDWQKDMQRVKDAHHARTCVNQPFPRLAWQEMLPDPWEDVAEYWLQEAKTLRDIIEMAMNEYHLWQSGDAAAPMMYGILEEAMSTLYPDTPAPKEGSS